MTADEKSALEWLDHYEVMGLYSQRRNARTIKAMLARPVLPEEPTREALEKIMIATWGVRMSGSANVKNIAADVYRALYAHLTAPKTKTETFTRWLVVTPRAEHGPYAGHDDAIAMAKAQRGTIIELTGKGEVPA